MCREGFVVSRFVVVLEDLRRRGISTCPCDEGDCEGG
jgi:hypothetical protein